MNEGLNLLLQAIPDTDSNYNLKRIEVMRWHQFCGVKVLDEKSEYFAASLLNNDTYWDGYKLKRTLLGEKILNDKNIMSDYDRYRFASLMCSKEKVREHFLKRSGELGRSVEDLVTHSFRRIAKTKLENFWSHYANIIDVESPSPIIIDSFKEMISFQGFNYDSQSDIWKYGFWCAQVVGSVDAMDFFVKKLVKNREEKDQFLIDTIAKIKFGTVDIYSDDRTLEYCIEHLSPDKYKLLMEQEVKTRGCFTILGRLTEIHLYNYTKQLASCLSSQDIANKDYRRLLYRVFHPKYFTMNELNQQRNELFLWLWNSQTFKDQKLDYLNNLDKASQRSIMLKIIENNEFSLFKVIIDDANSHQIKIALKEGCSICKALYKKNQRSLLLQMFNSIENSDQFLVIADQLLFSHLNKTLSKNQTLCSKKVFDLYTTGNKDDLFKYIEAVFETKRDCYNPLIHDMDQLVSEVFYSMIEGKYNPQSIINFNDRVSSLLNEPSFTTNPQNRRI